MFDVRISITTSDYKFGNFPALPIERCQCPRNYAGSSCEECADGFFRAQAGPFGGFCTACQCNNHADTCDPVSGKCINCRDHTTGDHCDQCIGGYFGDAPMGTPHDCLICSCPLPSITNNFALSCDISPLDNDVHCECKPGYFGTRCGVCAPGYYGEPYKIGQFCKSCECNDNIDASSPHACDDISGVCLQCLNHTHGAHCERCEPGYYGDAIDAKDCKGCTCDECGTRNCHHYTGNCECHDNVVGDRCDRCDRDFWGFASCQGCHGCNCDVASESSQCDLETGQCSCKQGVNGQRCDRCRPGYWDYSENGCTECSCRGGFSIGVGCDPLSGQCSCLPGVVGPNCDGCPHRWALIEGYGCEECDDCVHALLDTTDELANLIYPVIGEYASAAQSFFLHQRLLLINGSLEELFPKVSTLNINDDDLMPVRDALDDMQNSALAVSAKADLFLARAISSSSDGQTVNSQAADVLSRIDGGMDLARNVVDEINKLVIGLETGEGAKIEQAIIEAEYIVTMMQQMNSTFNNDKVMADLENALDYLNLIKNLTFPVMLNNDDLQTSVVRLKKLNDKIDEMQNYINDAQEQTSDVNEMNRKSKIYGLGNVEKKYSEIGHIGDITMDQIKDGQNYTAVAEENLRKAQFNYIVLGDQINEMKDANEQMNHSVTDTGLHLDDTQFTAAKSANHARQLRDRADRLDGMLVETRHVTENALAAANAYKNIVAAIDDAYDAAMEASVASDKAVDMSMGMTDNSMKSLGASEEIFSIAQSKVSQVEDALLPRLNQAQMDVRMLKHMDELQGHHLDGIKVKLDGIPRQSLGETARNLQEMASHAEQEATQVNDGVNGRYESLEEYRKEARDLSKNLEGAKRDTKLAFEQIKNVEDILPGMQESARDLLGRKDVIQDRLQDVGDRLERLRRTIKSARERTNKIKVGIDFESGDVVELKNPENLIGTATASELSVYIRTTEPDGLPLFLGTPVGGSSQLHRTSTDDFLALELDRGYAKLTTNLGAGSHAVTNEVYVADGKWHKIVVKRISKVVQLSVFSEDKETGIEEVTAQYVLPGTYSILNLDPKVSKLYVGGIPPGVEVESSLRSTNYIGQMEELWINGQPIGLWNFVSKGVNPLKGARERDMLRGSASDSLGLRFSGTGFTSVETKGREISPLSLILSFKTFAEDGLLYLLENRMNQYVSLELRGGRILYQHNFGSGAVNLISDKVYNDNKWHVIEATRVAEDALMQIDQTEARQGKSQGYLKDFTETPELMYFGGYAGDHVIPGVTNMKYRGCIRDVSISEVSVDFLRSTESIGTVPGCQEEVVSLVSFKRENPGYVHLQSPHDVSLQLVFKFKTFNPNGLLFYTETQDKTIYLSLSMAEGALVLRSAPGGEITTGAYTQYNDSSWHIVIATRENNELRLDIDDFEKYSIQLIQESVPFDGPAFFGGLPDRYSVDPAASAVDTNFVGCLGDATLNGKIINFAASTDRPHALMDVCMLPKDVTVVTYLPESEVRHIGVPISESQVPALSPAPDASERPAVDDKTPLPFFTYGPSDRTEAPVYATTTQPLDRCALPVTPMKDMDVRPENGARFGNKRDTRIEYEELPDNMRGDFVFSLDFRTQANEGIIFYASSINHRDYVTIYMNDGKIVFSFSAGTTPATMRSTQKYNDEKWHKLVSHRSGGEGRLEIDGYIVANGSISGSAKHIEHMAPYYYGGLDTEIIENAQDNTDRTDLSFNGCLRGFRMNNKIVGGKRSIIGVSECSYKVESGIFYGEGPKSHVVVRRRFNVGMTFELSLELKPRRNSGVIISVHGRRDFILLQLREGIVEAKVDNGRGIVTSQFNSSSAFSICDGRWHKVHVVKNKHVIILIVDGVNALPGTGPLGASSCDTHSPFFLGTQPRIGRRRGNAVSEKYVGCMRNVNLNLQEVDLAYALFVGNVNAGVCPLQ